MAAEVAASCNRNAASNARTILLRLYSRSSLVLIRWQPFAAGTFDPKTATAEMREMQRATEG